MTEDVKVKKTRKKKVNLIDAILSETVVGNSSSIKPIEGSVAVLIKHNGAEVERINPNALEMWVNKRELDYSSVQRIMNRTYVNHEGYTFEHI